MGATKTPIRHDALVLPQAPSALAWPTVDAARADLKRIAQCIVVARAAKAEFEQPIKKYITPYLTKLKEVEQAARAYLNAVVDSQVRQALSKVSRQTNALERRGRAEEALAIREVVAGSATDVPTMVRWAMRVVDAASVPREYCVPDEVALRKLAGPDHPEISGVIYEQVRSIINR